MGISARTSERSREHGLTLAMPVEKSGQNEFDFDYGEDFSTHIEKFDPDFSKVLVRYDREVRQLGRLKRLHTGCTHTTASSCSSCSCRLPTISSRGSAATPTVTTRSCDRS